MYIGRKRSHPETNENDNSPEDPFDSDSAVTDIKSKKTK